jgi:hypothetical protein
MPKSYLVVHLSKSKDTILPEKPATSVPSWSNGLPRSGRSLKTPIRRFFKLEVLKSNSNAIRNKRSRSEGVNREVGTISNPLANTPPLSSDIATSPITELDTPDAGQRVQPVRSLDQHYTPPVPCMALQNSDHSIDAVVISTLLKLPFCCHEDLLTMSPSRIVEVAQEMNERLPEALKIDLSQPRDYGDIRRDVEVLVGIVKSTSGITVPGAPLKRVKSRGRLEPGRVADVNFADDLDFRAISPPTSPLAFISATRRRRRTGQAKITAIMSPTKLTMLREEDEPECEFGETDMRCQLEDAEADSDEDVFRAMKKRRTSVSSEENVEMITPTMRRIKVPLKLQKLYDDINTSPTSHHVLTAHSRRKIILEDGPTSFSGKPSNIIVKTTVIDRSLAHTRARYRSSFKFSQNIPQIGRSLGPLQTSTPKLVQVPRENRFPQCDLSFLDVTPKFGHTEQTEVKPTSNDVASRIPRYRRVNVKRGSRSSFVGVGDFMVVDRFGRKDIDTVNKTF